MSGPDFHELDVFATPLAGLGLIEASAGTGKTWTITGLYLRLIVEAGLKVEQILVVTYTKAATAELRERIRRRLSDALQALTGTDAGDVFCQTLVQRCADPDMAIRRLTLAIRNFDEASVYTIHGFCQRVLTESAFESGTDFDSELIPDETELLREIVDDFWRRETAGSAGLWIDYLADHGQTPDVWRAAIRAHVGKPYLTLAPLPPAPDTAALEAALTEAFRKAQALWIAERAPIAGLLIEAAQSKVLKNNIYAPNKLAQWFDDIAAYFDQPQPAMTVPDKLAKLTPTELQKGTAKGGTAPQHDFFALCGSLVDAAKGLEAGFELQLRHVHQHLLAECDAELPLRKARLGLLSYDDLLNRLADALGRDGGPHLAESLRQRYPAALIDEFQDTDPVQYDIFRRVYRDTERPVFFVGDPKQAIYGFRGADVFSYLQARGEAGAHYTLLTNQRSTPKLIEAVGRLFEASSDPFLFEAIGYPAVRAADKARAELTAAGDDPAPLRISLLPPGFNSKGEEVPLDKGRANALATAATAAEIARLLNLASSGNAVLGDRPVGGGDIAVLVPTHRQGELIRKALTQRGIPSVRHGQDNVYACAEAQELERVLLAIAEPQRESRIRSALATGLMGWDGASIYRLVDDERDWERLLARFAGYRELWQQRGFMPMFRRWFEDAEVATRLLAGADGERRLTNTLHLAELLQVAGREQPGPDRLLSWFSRTLRDPAGDDEEALLRLESDADRVKIVTIHTSKGLEYPIVFCPFLWDGALWRGDETAAAFHDPNAGLRPVLDLGSADYERNRRLASREKLAEKLRLLYVALTRAVHRCYVVWGRVKSMETSALSWLLHGPQSASADPLAELESVCAGLTLEAVEARLREITDPAADAVAITPLLTDAEFPVPAPENVTAAELALAPFNRTLAAGWRMTSFTALTQGRHSEGPDYDAPKPAVDEPVDDGSIFAFPRGSVAGRCLHAVFEEWAFDRDDHGALDLLARRKLKAHGLAESWSPVVGTMVLATLRTPLNDDGLKLAGLGRHRRLAELEFTYPLRRLDARRLRQILADPAHGLPQSFVAAGSELQFDAVHGFMKGFIDLGFEADGRFYLADYKSNWLGNRPADYAPDKLLRAMAGEHYYLQYLIYCVALHRYLRLRLPDYDYRRHFGGVYYLFLRGIGHDGFPQAGIFHDRPAAGLIEALDDWVGRPTT